MMGWTNKHTSESKSRKVILTEQEGSPDWPELASPTLGITQLWEPGPLRGGGAPKKQGVPRASHKEGDVSGNHLLRSV